jgi:hypothetical protein
MRTEFIRATVFVIATAKKPTGRNAMKRLALATAAGVLLATDLESGVLPAGLTRDELWEKLKGHAKGAAGMVGLYGRQ